MRVVRLNNYKQDDVLDAVSDEIDMNSLLTYMGDSYKGKTNSITSIMERYGIVYWHNTEGEYCAIDTDYTNFNESDNAIVAKAKMFIRDKKLSDILK